MSARDADCLIVGGGPAGATLALLLRQEGKSVVVVDRCDPRRGIPEETMVPSARGILQRVGAMASIRAGAFYGTDHHDTLWGDGTWSTRRAALSDRGFKVDRARFDADLLRMARALGAAVHTHAQIRDVPGLGSGVVKIRTRDGETVEIAAQVIVVAIGKAIGGEHLTLEVLRRLPAMIALSCIVAETDERRPTTRIEAVPEGWLWWLPLHDGRASLTLFCDPDEEHRLGRDEIFRSALRHSSGPAAGADLVPTFGAAATARLVRSTSPVLMIGDAASTIDPLSSQGLEKALASAEQAVFAVNTMLETSIDRARIVARHATWERGLWLAHARESLHHYAREVRFSDMPFWRKRHEIVKIEHVRKDAGTSLPDLLQRAAHVRRRQGLERKGRLYVEVEGYGDGEDDVIEKIGPVPIAPIVESLDGPTPIEDLLRRLAQRPDFVALNAPQLRHALTELCRRGIIGPPTGDDDG